MVVGIGLSLFAAFSFAIGNVLEKRAVDGMHTFSLRNARIALKQIKQSPLWLIGAFASALGALVQIFAYHFVSISIVQSLSVAGIAFIVTVSRMHFREIFSRIELAGLIVCLVALASVMSSIQDGGTSPGKKATWLSVAIVFSTALAVVALLLANKRLRTTRHDFVLGTVSGILYGLVGVASKGISTTFANRGTSNIVLTILQTPYLYLMVACWALAIVLFQVGLQKGRVGMVAPLSGAMSAIFVVAVGTPLYGEHLPQHVVPLILRLVGLFGILLGSTLLATNVRENLDKSEPGNSLD